MHDMTTSHLRDLTLQEFLKLPNLPRQPLLSPWLPQKGLAMVVAPRGIGKTHFALSVAYAVASGGTFLKFSAPSPEPVLYIDGEMPTHLMQERLTSIGPSFPTPHDNLRLLTADMSEYGLPDLSTHEGRALMDAHVRDAKLVILDNLSTLIRGGKENEAESWAPLQEWALRHRQAGRCILFIHHTGKSGQQRGTSKREDVLDTVMSLRRPLDYSHHQGARFEIHFDKARSFYGKDAESFEAQYAVKDDAVVWTHTSIDVKDLDLQRVVDAVNSGVTSVRDIGKACGFSKDKAARLKKQAVQQALLEEDA